MVTCLEELRRDNCLVLFLRFLILFDFGKNLGFFVRISRRSGPRAYRSGHIEKARHRGRLCRYLLVFLHRRSHRSSFLRRLRLISRLILGCLGRGSHLLFGAVERVLQFQVTGDKADDFDYAVTRPMHRTTYWLDIGNNAASGQYILGQPLNSQNRRKAARLRTVSELYPEIVDAAAGEDPLPSCSAIEALDRQEPFINQTLASSALAMLARLFRYGRLSHHGAFFNAETGRMSALPIDPQMWTKVRRRNRRFRAAA